MESTLESMLWHWLWPLERRLYKVLHGVLRYGQRRLLLQPEDEGKFLRDLKVLHRSDNFIAVDKNPDLVINDNDLKRLSVYRQMQFNFPELVESKHMVRVPRENSN